MTNKRVLLMFFEKQIGFNCLKILAGRLDEFSVIAVSTSKNIVSFGGLEKFCRLAGMRFFIEDKPNRPEFVSEIKNLNPELAFAISYSKIFREEVIGIFPNGIVNLHPALLPRQKGCFPTMWSIIEGDKTTGYTLHKIDAGIDTGPIFAQVEVAIADDDTGESLYVKQIRAGEQLFKDCWLPITNGQIKARPQGEGGCYHNKELPFGGYIPWDRDVAFIKRIIRAFSNRDFRGILAKTDFGDIEVVDIEKTNEPDIKMVGRVVRKDEKLFSQCADALVRIYPKKQ